jgi:hypothetical protein
MIAGRKIAGRNAGAGRVEKANFAGEAAFRRVNTSSINHKIHGERFVKPGILACSQSGPLAGAAQVGKSS